MTFEGCAVEEVRTGRDESMGVGFEGFDGVR